MSRAAMPGLGGLDRQSDAQVGLTGSVRPEEYSIGCFGREHARPCTGGFSGRALPSEHRGLILLVDPTCGEGSVGKSGGAADSRLRGAPRTWA